MVISLGNPVIVNQQSSVPASHSAKSDTPVIEVRSSYKVLLDRYHWIGQLGSVLYHFLNFILPSAVVTYC